MKTIAGLKAVIENSDPRFHPRVYDRELLRASLFELIALHIDGKLNQNGYDLTDLSLRLKTPCLSVPAGVKEQAAEIALRINEIIDWLD